MNGVREGDSSFVKIHPSPVCFVIGFQAAYVLQTVVFGGSVGFNESGETIRVFVGSFRSD